MENSAFSSSSIRDSNVNADAYKCGPQSVMANNSPIQQLTINNISNYHGDSQTGRPKQSSNDVQQSRPRVTFEEATEKRILRAQADPSMIPAGISRLLIRNESAKPAHPKQPSCSVSGKSTRGGPRFKVVEENRQTMQDKLNQRSPFVREYMQSDLFFSDTAIPLWEPSPGYNFPREFKISNVCVGDVGIFTREGGFHVLFNIFLSRSDNVELGFTPPHNFEPYDDSVQFSDEVSRITLMSLTKYKALEGDFKSDPEIPHHPDHPKRKYIRAYHLVRKHGKAQKGVRSGTLLDLPNGFWRDSMHPTVVLAMQGYSDRHAESWYNHRTEHSGPIPAGHLNIVSTSYKCRSWALAIGQTKSPDKIYARLSPFPKSKILYEWDTHEDIVGRTGPLLEEKGDDGLPLTNQCVALEVHSIEKANSIEKMGAVISKMSIRSSASRASRADTIKSGASRANTIKSKLKSLF